MNTNELISVKGREALVYHSAHGVEPHIEHYAGQISAATSTTNFTKPLTKEQAAEMIKANLFTLIVDAMDPTKLLAHASRKQVIRRAEQVSVIGAWGSTAPGFGRTVMELTAAKAEGPAYALVHWRNGPAKNAMRNLGARRIGLKRSKDTGNLVFVYEVTPGSRRRSR